LLSTSLPPLPALPLLVSPPEPPSTMPDVPALLDEPPVALPFVPALLLVPAVEFCEPGPESPLPALQCVNRSRHAGTQTRALTIVKTVSGSPKTNHKIEQHQIVPRKG